MDTSRASNLARILRFVIANALSDGDPTGNRAAWYHCRLLAVPSNRDRVYPTISNRIDTKVESFQDSRPPPDAVPVTVLFETPTLLRCSVPPMPPEAVHDTARTPTCETFAVHVVTLPPWERELLAHATELYCPDSSLFEVLQQKKTTILAASDGGQKDDHGSFGRVIGTKVIWDCEGVARGYPMQSYRAEGYGRMSLLLFLAHYIRFYNIKPAAGLRVISYFDSYSLLKAEEAFHNKDVDSSAST
jgi:hypothetical protein